MKCWPWLMTMPVALGCINGVPLPPTPASSLAPVRVPTGGEQEVEYIELAKNYVRAEGKDPTQATYQVHRSLHHDDQPANPDDGPATAAIVEVNFFSASPWELEIKTNGDIVRREGH